MTFTPLKKGLVLDKLTKVHALMPIWSFMCDYIGMIHNRRYQSVFMTAIS